MEDRFDILKDAAQTESIIDVENSERNTGLINLKIAFYNLGVFFEIKRKISENQIILIEFLVIRCYTIYGGA